MTRYVALLRGINVGGHRKVPMAELRTVLEGLGYGEVRTYLQSGNAVFDAPGPNAAAVREETEAAIAARFGFPVDCLVLTAPGLHGTAARCPFPAAGLDPAKVLVLFAGEELDAARLAAIDPAAHAPDVFETGEREVFCWFPDGMGRSRLPDAVTSALRGTVLTGRNWRTVTRLRELAAPAT
ncbi:DUF1697 domain-containing protein [Streptomyces sp. TRM 70351]|uniref:DUF1697 domain-containing protein n=1 Tax=Streptomyces sp. TRM 70351 TaxID=3116552 RepID=UPI002E7B7A5E|nr:DUF1697 domain-containing protein [Streptomyces sp. TRM 70351]MEE1926823.1 DUF1697 domain-containing protein [Streptomyces sp. TRM 70351]